MNVDNLNTQPPRIPAKWMQDEQIRALITTLIQNNRDLTAVVKALEARLAALE
jgi:hypothetical protein